MKKTILLLTLFVVSGIGSVFSQLSQVPFTNRFQIVLLNESDLINKSKIEYAAFLKTRTVVSASDPDAALVIKVGKRLEEATRGLLTEYGLQSRLKGFAFEFNLVKSNEVNAWCMPGGKIAVYTGILPYCKDEGAMAALIAHEIAHAIAQHGNERLSQEIALQAGISILEGQFSDYVKDYKDVFDMVFGVGSGLGLLAYSREHEYEADLIGMYLMAYAGYKPVHAQYFWEKMMKAGGSDGFEFLSTHPASENRLAEIKKKIPEAEKFYKKK